MVLRQKTFATADELPAASLTPVPVVTAISRCGVAFGKKKGDPSRGAKLLSENAFAI